MADSIELIKAVLVWQQKVVRRSTHTCGLTNEARKIFSNWCCHNHCERCPMKDHPDNRNKILPPLRKNIKQKESDD